MNKRLFRESFLRRAYTLNVYQSLPLEKKQQLYYEIKAYQNGSKIELTGNIDKVFQLFKKEYNKYNIANKKNWFYIVTLENKREKFVKIGISNNIENRYKEYNRIGFVVTEHKKKLFANRLKARRIEVEYHKLFSKHKYMPKNKFSGFTECFKLSVLEKINDKTLKL